MSNDFDDSRINVVCSTIPAELADDRYRYAHFIIVRYLSLDCYRRCYCQRVKAVANTGSNTVSIIDGNTDSVVVKVGFNVNPLNSGNIQCNGQLILPNTYSWPWRPLVWNRISS
ncbi:MAG: hypothetical protein WAK17_28900 [Candidatus Nitrosopolaris sp.]